MILEGKKEVLYSDGTISFNTSTIDSIHRTQELYLGRHVDVNCLVVGQSGSGLSSLLNIITANLVRTYSRYDIKLVLVGRGHSDLNVFTTDDNKRKLLTKGDNIDCYFGEDAKFIISKFREISNVCDDRLKLMNDNSVKSMSEYNKLAALADCEFFRLTPIILICDDLVGALTNLSDEDDIEFNKYLSKILAIGRAVGVHIIASASNTHCNSYSYDRLYEQCSLKICLKVDSTTSLRIFGSEHASENTNCSGYAYMRKLEFVDSSKYMKLDVSYIPYEELIDRVVCDKLSDGDFGLCCG